MLQRLLIAAAFLSFASAARAQEPPAPEQCAQAWNAVLVNETAATLENFIAVYGACAEADQARQGLIALTNIEAATAPAEEEPRGGSGGFLGGVIGGNAGRVITTPAPPPAPGASAPVDRTVYIAAG